MKKLLLALVLLLLPITAHAQTTTFANPQNSVLSSLGIGTSSAASTLAVSGGVAIGTAYAGSNAAASNNLIVQGSVGIGTSTPTHPLDVFYSNNSYAPGLVISNTNTGTTAISQMSLLNQNGNNAGFAYYPNNYTNAAVAGKVAVYSNTGIAFQADNSTTGTDNIDFIIGSTASNVLMRLAASGRVGIGTTAPQQALHVVGTIEQTTELSCATGLTTDANGAINGCVASDISLKQDIENITFDPTLIDRLRPVTYHWIDSSKFDNKIHSGFIAQEVQLVDPFAVKPAGKDLLGIDNSALAADIVLDLQAIHRELDAEHGAFPFHKCFLNLLVCAD